MTENEAIRILQCFEKWNEDDHWLRTNCMKKLVGCCVDALEEIQHYREIGTVEACREAMEKQKAKKPKDSLKINPVIDGNGAYVDADMTVYLFCPNCGEMVEIDDYCDNYCRECGQKIDKESEEE